MTEKILAIIFVFIKSVMATTGYGGLVILMAIESACIPLPSELIMPFAGYLVHEGSMKLIWVATAGAIGCNPGDRHRLVRLVALAEQDARSGVTPRTGSLPRLVVRKCFESWGESSFC